MTMRIRFFCFIVLITAATVGLKSGDKRARKGNPRSFINYYHRLNRGKGVDSRVTLHPRVMNRLERLMRGRKRGISRLLYRRSAKDWAAVTIVDRKRLLLQISRLDRRYNCKAVIYRQSRKLFVLSGVDYQGVSYLDDAFYTAKEAQKQLAAHFSLTKIVLGGKTYRLKAEKDVSGRTLRTSRSKKSESPPQKTAASPSAQPPEKPPLMEPAEALSPRGTVDPFHAWLTRMTAVQRKQLPLTVYRYFQQSVKHQTTSGMVHPADLITSGRGDHDDIARAAAVCLVRAGYTVRLVYLPLRRYEQAHDHIVVLFQTKGKWRWFDNMRFGQKMYSTPAQVAARVVEHSVYYRVGAVSDEGRVYWRQTLKKASFNPLGS